MPAWAEDMVWVPLPELDALRTEDRRLRCEAGDREALKRIRSDAGKAVSSPATSWLRRGALVSDRFSGSLAPDPVSLRPNRTESFSAARWRSHPSKSHPAASVE
jgi:hypothetical protein